MNILIIEDEVSMAQSIKKHIDSIQQVNITSVSCDFNDAFHKIMSQSFNLFLIDIHLSHDEHSGLDLCHIIRKNSPHASIIIITAFHSIFYMEKAFAAGVNDYITKPFNPKELQIRVKRWLQPNTVGEKTKRICYQDLCYESENNTFYFGESFLELTKKNKSLLLVFLHNPEKVLTKEYIQEKLWGDYDTSHTSRNVRSNIQALREDLERYQIDSCIETVRGEGYMLRL